MEVRVPMGMFKGIMYVSTIAPIPEEKFPRTEVSPGNSRVCY
jgi:hypothetical protein